MFKKIWNWILSLFGKGKEETPNNDINLHNAIWYGVGGQHAVVTQEMIAINYVGDIISYIISVGTEAWRPKEPRERNCNMYGCYFVQRNGQYMGGKFEWSTYSRKFRKDHNIKDGKAGGIKPMKGETVWICFINLHGTERTNALPVTWK